MLDDNYGYSQPNRSSGYNTIIANGGRIAGATSIAAAFCFAAYQYAGLQVGSGYTGNLEMLFMATGKFAAHREPEYLDSGAIVAAWRHSPYGGKARCDGAIEHRCNYAGRRGRISHLTGTVCRHPPPHTC